MLVIMILLVLVKPVCEVKGQMCALPRMLTWLPWLTLNAEVRSSIPTLWSFEVLLTQLHSSYLITICQAPLKLADVILADATQMHPIGGVQGMDVW